MYLRDRGDTEIGAFGISSPSDPLLVEDLQLVDQNCTAVTVQFVDTSVADFFDAQVDCGRVPEQFGRLWLHTHPGDCPWPSGTDEETFARVFGRCHWAVMFILARGGDTSARLSHHAGPPVSLPIETRVDFTAEFPASDHVAWEAEYRRHVRAFDPGNVALVEALRTEASKSPGPATDELHFPEHWKEEWHDDRSI